ncbi:MAG TPA: lytic transglycosylase domain-containing protein [Chitinophagaceae bacterium]|nr:lytic transglycosylase domain-containing protein [Chitinophagaceae bacterium]
MLKRKLARASLFANGLVFFIASVNGRDHLQPSDSIVTKEVDPIVRQLQAFDSSFINVSEFPSDVLANAPKIRLSAYLAKFVRDYNQKNDEILQRIKDRSSLHFTMMDSIFIRYHLPIELKYLAVVESEMDARAHSHVGAVGPWQLMPETARDLSLKIRGKYDERRNYYKSTIAAAKYLKDLYGQFGDWLLVIAAYNSGPGKVLGAIKKTGSRNFWAIQRFLPAETRGHVKRFIATHYYFEGDGGVTTLTKKETMAHKNAISEYFAKQRADIEKTKINTSDVTIAAGTPPEKK